MENPPSPAPAPAPITPLGARTPHTHPGLYAVITGLSLIIIIGALWVFWPDAAVAPETPLTPTPSVSSFPTPDPSTAGWKTYTNAQYGFEFKYPADRTLHDSGTTSFNVGLDVEHPTYDKERFELDIIENSPSTDLACPPNQVTTCIAEYRNIHGESIVVTTSGTGEGSNGKSGSLLKNGTLYRFYTGFTGSLYSKFDLAELAREQILFDKILSTFRFTNSATSEWKSLSGSAPYQSEYKVTMKYPADWIASCGRTECYVANKEPKTIREQDASLCLLSVQWPYEGSNWTIIEANNYATNVGKTDCQNILDKVRASITY